jgi:flagellum-specific peptidoglycan hydrolase FlgJ
VSLTAQQLKNLTAAARCSVAAEQETGCPADLTIAQWALESGWGLDMPARSNNPFGIKALPGQMYVETLTTEEVKGEKIKIVQRFRVFSELTEAFFHHGELITTGKPYADAWAQYQVDENLVSLVKGIAVHYSTTKPGIYSKSLLGILIMKPVQDALAAARADASQELETH